MKPIVSKLKNPIPALILILGGLLLFSYLDLKPAQHDEGVNGMLIEEVIQRGFYPYDPTGYHGPLYFYILFIFKLLFGHNLIALRLPAVLFSLATLWLFLRLRPYIGKWTAYTLALFAAVSPGFTFYSRYAIHESSFLFFSVLTLLGYFRYRAKADRSSIWLIGMGLTGVLLTKETYIISLGAFFAAWVGAKLYQSVSPASDYPVKVKPSYKSKDLRMMLWASVWILLLFYTGFFQNPGAIFYLFKSLWDWVVIGMSATSEQQHLWRYFGYFIELMSRYEWVALIGLFLCLRLFSPLRWSHRLIGFYGLIQLLIYSSIRYKTPWCILQMLWPFFFLTASSIEAFVASKKKRKDVALGIILVLAILSSWQTLRLNFYHYEDDQEPYVDTQTYSDIVHIYETILAVVEEDPAYKHMPIHVVMKAYWPISWMFQGFSRMEYDKEFYPPHGDAGVIFCDQSRREVMELKFKKSYFIQEFRLNPSQEKALVYFDAEIFKNYFDENTPRFDPTPITRADHDEGLRLTIFEGQSWDGVVLHEEKIDSPLWVLDSTERFVEEGYSAYFEGKIFIPKTGLTTFYLASDDGSQLEIEGEILIDNLGEHEETVKSVEKYFESGWHAMRIKYFDVRGDQVMRLWWRLPGSFQENIQPEFLTPKKYAEDKF